MSKKQKETKGKDKPAPVVHVPRVDKLARTAANKARRMARDDARKARKAQRKKVYVYRKRQLRVALETWVMGVADNHLRRYFKRHPQGAITFAGVEYGPGVLMLDERGM